MESTKNKRKFVEVEFSDGYMEEIFNVSDLFVFMNVCIKQVFFDWSEDRSWYTMTLRWTSDERGVFSEWTFRDMKTIKGFTKEVVKTLPKGFFTIDEEGHLFYRENLVSYIDMDTFEYAEENV